MEIIVFIVLACLAVGGRQYAGDNRELKRYRTHLSDSLTQAGYVKPWFGTSVFDELYKKKLMAMGYVDKPKPKKKPRFESTPLEQ